MIMEGKRRRRRIKNLVRNVINLRIETASVYRVNSKINPDHFASGRFVAATLNPL